MSYNLALDIQNVSKVYEVYKNPHDRLLQILFGKYKKFYKEFVALSDINFNVEKGECVGIVGRNGAGKSTLLQIITGIMMPSSGSVSCSGRIAALLELGSGFNNEFSGRENIYMNAAILGIKENEIEKKIDEIVDFADIPDFIDQPLKTYSSGMMLRLAFAVQTQVDPEILIIDEALAVGDAIFQTKCYKRINELRDKGTTILFVSHDQEAVRTLTNRCVLLEKGKQLMFDDSSKVILEYRNLINTHKKGTEEGSGSIHQEKEALEVKQALVEKTDSDSSASSKKQEFKNEFGGTVARITAVKVCDENDKECDRFYPHDLIKIYVTFKVNEDTEHLNINVRIRNLQGVKIYSWGTLNQDMVSKDNNIFRNLKFKKGEERTVVFSCINNLGDSFYEVQAGITTEKTFDYTDQTILHWIDGAGYFYSSFRSSLSGDFFGGTNNLNMKAEIL